MTPVWRLLPGAEATACGSECSTLLEETQCQGCTRRFIPWRCHASNRSLGLIESLVPLVLGPGSIMSRPSNATTSGGSVRPPVHRNAPSPTASSSKATPRDTNVSVRSDPESDDLYSNPEKQPSHVDKGEAKAAEELKKYLDDAELSGKPLPARTRVDWSDSHAQSPWSKKTILALGMSGPHQSIRTGR